MPWDRKRLLVYVETIQLILGVTDKLHYWYWYHTRYSVNSKITKKDQLTLQNGTGCWMLPCDVMVTSRCNTVKFMNDSYQFWVAHLRLQVAFQSHLPFARKMQNYGDAFSKSSNILWFHTTFIYLISKEVVHYTYFSKNTLLKSWPANGWRFLLSDLIITQQDVNKYCMCWIWMTVQPKSFLTCPVLRNCIKYVCFSLMVIFLGW